MTRRGPSPQKRAADRRKRRRLADVVLERLGERYAHPTWAGPRVDTVSELVLTILSQNTADTNSFRAFTALRERYATWDDALVAPTDELEDVIGRAGWRPPSRSASSTSWPRSTPPPAVRGTCHSWGRCRCSRRAVARRARHRPQDGLDHSAVRLRTSRHAGRHPRPSSRDAARHAAAAHSAPPRARPPRGGAGARRDVPVPRRDHPPRARHVPGATADLRHLSADRCLRVLRARREGQGTDGARPQGQPGRTARRAITTSSSTAGCRRNNCRAGRACRGPTRTVVVRSPVGAVSSRRADSARLRPSRSAEVAQW